ncbi:hypothetical protein [Endozoicomonas sp. SCSIO W0465]|uniref:hypothetical protein n=1 Tax=Endozoicomonas sp. SCSIO W0465 TaxID=2918516 RepID=UPI0020755414|nr:hypothetical protein [Endozoicomonas sp. SCSIO W0465]USE39440.1 hypothetical protein MJO57_15495 [Endozoicomonas sp. SCSIO W0465]
MLANIVEKWCLRGWYKNQKIPDLCGGAEQLPLKNSFLGGLRRRDNLIHLSAHDFSVLQLLLALP